jgi:Protein of unknown function (DUF3168)
MIDALKNAIFNSMSQDDAIKALIGNPLRLYDPPIRHSAFPFVVWRRIETKPIAQDYSNAQEIIITLEIVSKSTGQDEAKKAVQAINKWAQSAKPIGDGVNIIMLMSAYSDVFRAIDGRTFFGVVRLKIIAE